MERPLAPSRTKRHETKRLDTLLALPLDRFRRALTGLTTDDLAALDARLALQQVRSRWARGGFGIARHRSPQELALLRRRATALRNERSIRAARGPEPIQLVFPDAGSETSTDGIDKLAA
jgi:hypothetical protein